MEIVVKGCDLPERDDPAFGRLAPDIAERDGVDRQQPRNEAVDRSKAGAAHPRGVEPGHKKQQDDGAER